MNHHFQSLKLKLINVGYDKLDQRWDFDNVISPFTRLYLITKGEAFVYHNNKKFHLKPDNLYLIPSYTYSSYKCPAQHNQYYISFSEELGTGLSIYNLAKFNFEIKACRLDYKLFELLLSLNPDRGLVNNDPEHYDKKSVLQRFERRNNELSAGRYVETQGILKVLFSRFINGTSASSNYNKPKLNRTLSYISENLQCNLNLQILADHANLGKDHFSRSFKAYFGVSPSKYIQQMRLERALLLLMTTNLSVKEIALKTGFSNYTYFLNFFKKRLTKTPMEFRNTDVIL